MDPSEMLEELRVTLRELDSFDAHVPVSLAQHAVEVFTTLDQHLKGGGQLPDDWRPVTRGNYEERYSQE